MSKARKTAARTRTAKSKRRTTARAGAKAAKSKATKKKTAARKARPRKKQRGIIAKVTNAVAMVAETSRESGEMARRMGPRGGLSEG